MCKSPYEEEKAHLESIWKGSSGFPWAVGGEILKSLSNASVNQGFQSEDFAKRPAPSLHLTLRNAK